MNNEYWHQKWRINDIGFNQLEPNKLLQKYIQSFKLKPGARIFLPLCGKSIDLLWLANEGYEVIGIELSQLACEAFFLENQIAVIVTHLNDFTIFQNENKKITLVCADFFKLTKKTLGSIDLVYDRAALIALPHLLRQAYAKHLISLLETTSSILLLTTAYAQNEMNGPPFSVDEVEVASLYEHKFNIQQFYNKPIENVPGHLQEKGLIKASEQAYYLQFKPLNS